MIRHWFKTVQTTICGLKSDNRCVPKNNFIGSAMPSTSERPKKRKNNNRARPQKKRIAIGQDQPKNISVLATNKTFVLARGRMCPGWRTQVSWLWDIWVLARGHMCFWLDDTCVCVLARRHLCPFVMGYYFLALRLMSKVSPLSSLDFTIIKWTIVCSLFAEYEQPLSAFIVCV